MKKVEFKLPSTAWGFPIASARFFTFHYSLFTKRRKLTRLWLVRQVQNLSRITLMRRICSFTDFYCVVGFLCACRAQWLSRIISYWRNPAPYRRKYNPKEILYNIQDQIKEIREKIKSVASALSVNSLSACGLSRRRRSTTMWYCLPDNSLLLSYKSRDFIPGYSRSARYCLPDKITWYYYASSKPSIVII